MKVVRTNVALLIASLTLAGGLLAGCGEKEAPVFPDFKQDVLPLLHARCVRCHGAGGTLNADGDVTAATPALKGAPIQGYFDCAEDRGTCTDPATPAPGCQRGFRFYSDGMGGVGARTVWLKQMPPPPAPPLTDREDQIIKAWLAHPSPANVPCQ